MIDFSHQSRLVNVLDKVRSVYSFYGPNNVQVMRVQEERLGMGHHQQPEDLVKHWSLNRYPNLLPYLYAWSSASLIAREPWSTLDIYACGTAPQNNSNTENIAIIVDNIFMELQPLQPNILCISILSEESQAPLEGISSTF